MTIIYHQIYRIIYIKMCIHKIIYMMSMLTYEVGIHANNRNTLFE